MHLPILTATLVVAATSAKPLVHRQCANNTVSWNSTIDSNSTFVSNSTVNLNSTVVSNSTVFSNSTVNLNSTTPYKLGNPNAEPNPIANSSLVSSLLTADTAVSRFRYLQDAIKNGTASTKFDYNPAANLVQNISAGGEVVVADRGVFPMVTDLGIAGAVFFFAPCGLNTPHIHPRASEIFTVSTNSTINAGFVLENGFAQQVNTSLTQYQGTVFPQGSIHWQQNTGCEPAVAIGALSSEDPGTSSLAQNFLVNTSEDVVQASLGYPEQITAENFASLKSKINPSFVEGVQECYRRCGLGYQ